MLRTCLKMAKKKPDPGKSSIDYIKETEIKLQCVSLITVHSTTTDMAPVEFGLFI